MSAQIRIQLVIGLVALAALGIFAAANAHLIWTSVRSQPDCVPHLKVPGQDGQFRAAQSSC
jgi:hypothetical protein